ncbi:MAG: hypothetical protein JWN38_1257 [Candidatus Saccharibacteria bacterium]|nr:hypothetical protein [Candidatus Saccharibacteria bacterium]
MDETAAELAKANVQFFAEEFGPLYEGMRRDLIGALAIEKASFADLVAKEESERANGALIRGLVDALPAESKPPLDHPQDITRAKGTYGTFKPQDELQAHGILSNVIWLSTYKQEYATYRRYTLYTPCYVVGASDKSYLLAATSSTKTDARIYEFTPSRRQRKKIAEVMAGFDRPMSPETMAAIFDKQTLSMVIAPSPQGVMEFFEPAEFGSEALTTVSDAMLAEYNVIHHLNRLAGIFSQEQALIDLLG